MKFFLECTIPDEDVPTAQANGPGEYNELVEWIISHFDAEARYYFFQELGFEMTIKQVSTLEKSWLSHNMTTL